MPIYQNKILNKGQIDDKDIINAVANKTVENNFSAQVENEKSLNNYLRYAGNKKMKKMFRYYLIEKQTEYKYCESKDKQPTKQFWQ